jgi:polyisoprenoid-binding protein YceI
MRFVEIYAQRQIGDRESRMPRASDDPKNPRAGCGLGPHTTTSRVPRRRSRSLPVSSSIPRSGRRTPSRPLVVGAIVALVVVVAGVAGVVYLFWQNAPAAVSLAGSTGNASGVAAGIEGTWTVDTSIGSFSDFSDSFVGYRVDENLANVGSATAVGRTPGVQGSMTVSGTSITAVKITADLTGLTSDRSMRDGQLHQQALETDRFPTATFELTAPIQLGHAPADGETIQATATGNLTLHGVTKAVSIALQAKLSGGVVTVVGTLPISFADYSISPPQSMMVLSVADNGTMELQLHFRHG